VRYGVALTSASAVVLVLVLAYLLLLLPHAAVVRRSRRELVGCRELVG
jgi:type II secretory pathway component PulM